MHVGRDSPYIVLATYFYYSKKFLNDHAYSRNMCVVHVLSLHVSGMGIIACKEFKVNETANIYENVFLSSIS